MQSTRNRGLGFASMSPEKKREIAGMGGRAAHLYGRAHKWTSQEAQRAGTIGGSLSRRGSEKLTEEEKQAVRDDLKKRGVI